ncbi:MAG TPA: HYR domain-containing protein, partial [Blastocatellia bacterium]|nr:HYR domain-containing protein [Blastocatellia bacterium]
PVGTTTVTCTAKDAAKNTSVCTFTVKVFRGGCLQDDSDPTSFVVFDINTGQYAFYCGGVLKASGTGTVTVQGCIYTINHNPSNRRVMIKVEYMVNRGTAVLLNPPSTTVCTITDKNLSNNSCNAVFP